jgi:hypothetical protein
MEVGRLLPSIVPSHPVHSHAGMVHRCVQSGAAGCPLFYYSSRAPKILWGTGPYYSPLNRLLYGPPKQIIVWVWAPSLAILWAYYFMVWRPYHHRIVGGAIILWYGMVWDGQIL